MRGVGLLAAAMVVALLLPGCAEHRPTALPRASDPVDLPPIEPGRGAISGLLIDDVYRPVPGGLILVEGLGLIATTDAEGQFQFLDLDPGSYILLANADRHEAAPVNVDVREGEYSEVEVAARRTFSDGGSIMTTQYSVFINCAVSAFVVTSLIPCVPDSSGDSDRDYFNFTDNPYGDQATALVLEMKASQSDGYALDLWCQDARAGSWTEVDSDYVHAVWARENATVPDQNSTIEKWPDPCHRLACRLWYLGSDPAQTRKSGLLPWGVGARIAIKATFMLSVFVGKPNVDLMAYHILSHGTR